MDIANENREVLVVNSHSGQLVGRASEAIWRIGAGGNGPRLVGSSAAGQQKFLHERTEREPEGENPDSTA